MMVFSVYLVYYSFNHLSISVQIFEFSASWIIWSAWYFLENKFNAVFERNFSDSFLLIFKINLYIKSCDNIWLDTRFLHPSVFQNLMRITIHCFANSISNDLFSSISGLFFIWFPINVQIIFENWSIEMVLNGSKVSIETWMWIFPI